MDSIRQYILEMALYSPHHLGWVPQGGDDFITVRFLVGGHPVNVMFQETSPGSGSYDVIFEAPNQSGEMKIDTTGAFGFRAKEVFGGVVHAVEEFVKNYRPRSLQMTSSEWDREFQSKRVSFYWNTFYPAIEKVTGYHKHVVDDITGHVIFRR